MTAVCHQSCAAARWPGWGTLTSWTSARAGRFLVAGTGLAGTGLAGTGSQAPGALTMGGAVGGRSSLEASGGEAGQDVALEDQEKDDRGNRGHGGRGDDEVLGCRRRPRDPDVNRFPGWRVAALDQERPEEVLPDGDEREDRHDTQDRPGNRQDYRAQSAQRGRTVDRRGVHQLGGNRIEEPLEQEDVEGVSDGRQPDGLGCADQAYMQERQARD